MCTGEYFYVSAVVSRCLKHQAYVFVVCPCHSARGNIFLSYLWCALIDYCNAVLAESPRVITDKLQRVRNSAARVVIDTRKYDSGLSQLMHDEFHWLDVTDRVRFKLAVLMYRCLHGTAPPYLMDSCTLTAEVTGRQHLRLSLIHI